MGMERLHEFRFMLHALKGLPLPSGQGCQYYVRFQAALREPCDDRKVPKVHETVVFLDGLLQFLTERSARKSCRICSSSGPGLTLPTTDPITDPRHI